MNITSSVFCFIVVDDGMENSSVFSKYLLLSMHYYFLALNLMEINLIPKVNFLCVIFSISISKHKFSMFNEMPLTKCVLLIVYTHSIFDACSIPNNILAYSAHVQLKNVIIRERLTKSEGD